MPTSSTPRWHSWKSTLLHTLNVIQYSVLMSFKKALKVCICVEVKISKWDTVYITKTVNDHRISKQAVISMSKTVNTALV
jgi:hypothetical protein